VVCQGSHGVLDGSLALTPAMQTNEVGMLQEKLWDFAPQLVCVVLARQVATRPASHQQSEVCARRLVTARLWRLQGKLRGSALEILLASEQVGCGEDWNWAATWRLWQ